MKFEDKLASGTQYRDFTALEPQDEMVVEGYATTFDTPYLLWRDGEYEVWEKVDRDAFNEANMWLCSTTMRGVCLPVILTGR